MWDSRSRAEMLLKLCKNVEVVKNVVVVVFFVKCGNDLNCVEMWWYSKCGILGAERKTLKIV